MVDMSMISVMKTILISWNYYINSGAQEIMSIACSSANLKRKQPLHAQNQIKFHQK
jgi:hypothetical protein